MISSKSILVASVFLLASGGSATADQSQSATDYLQAWAAAWQTGDVDKMMTFYDHANETLAIESLGHVRRGPGEIRKMYEGAFDEVTFERVILTPIASGQHDSVAWATYRYRAHTRLKSDNTRYVLEVRGSFVMKKQDDSWKITLEHFSTIPDVPRVRRVHP